MEFWFNRTLLDEAILALITILAAVYYMYDKIKNPKVLIILAAGAYISFIYTRISAKTKENKTLDPCDVM